MEFTLHTIFTVGIVSTNCGKRGGLDLDKEEKYCLKVEILDGIFMYSLDNTSVLHIPTHKV